MEGRDPLYGPGVVAYGPDVELYDPFAAYDPPNDCLTGEELGLA